MSHTPRISRRHILRGAGGVTIALPWLEAMWAGKVHAAAISPRVVFFNTMNGTIKPKWTPTGTETKPVNRISQKLPHNPALMPAVLGFNWESKCVRKSQVRKFHPFQITPASM